MTIFQNWLTEYGRYWEEKRTDKFASIFSEEALYYWTPFRKPLEGREEIEREVKKAISTQQNINFSFAVLSFNNKVGIAHWKCEITRIETQKRFTIDGILIAKLNENNLCDEFKEWWHSNEEAV